MNQPLVSIIIPTFNRAHLIGETLDSVFAQTYTNWECIIVDDGSMDNTDEVVGQYVIKDPRFQYHHRPNNRVKGASSCRNFGLIQAKGDFVIFLDSDDVLLNFCLQQRIDVVQNTKEEIFFWVFPMWIEDEDKYREVVKIPEIQDYLLAFLRSKIHWGIMCTFWEMTFIRKLEGFNELYPRLNDPELHIRAMLKAKEDFLVCHETMPDTIYRAASIKNKDCFAKNYEKSLRLFIPDIVELLKITGNGKLKKMLKGYLKHYFINFHMYNSRRNNIEIIKLFYNQKVISWKMYQNLKWCYYVKLLLTRILKMNIAKINLLLD